MEKSTKSTTCKRWAGVALALMLASAGPVWAQWKWKDSSGKVQYSDRPPPASVPDRDILQRPSGPRSIAPPPAEAAPAPAAAASALGVDKDLEARRRQEEQEREAKARAEKERMAQVRAENCTRARNYLQTLESGVRLTRTNAKGEREFLGDEARAAEVARTRELIAANCD
ncbi:DUF4124 domain-containing protein [Caldimonas sp.]|uniref:DUF4124 domain-containing protein n=1 Tax=Caldimonas sp. TaxID=2838790 RepID=UPI0029DE1252|nr:DUF4124 domain-containing protein [Caldimonas manganoxidans]